VAGDRETVASVEVLDGDMVLYKSSLLTTPLFVISN
jgi:hypothetical protein